MNATTIRANVRSHLLLALMLFAMTASAKSAELDNDLRTLLQNAGISTMPSATANDPNKVELGRMLFFDRELSGHRDTACATCHHPSTMSGDGRSLPSGTGGEGLGPDRTIGDGLESIPRNSPEIFDRGNSDWTSMFWDSRVANTNGHLQTPAGADLPDGLESPLAAQAMFPVTSRAEMRGFAGQPDAFGNTNELASLDDSNLTGIWDGLMNRVLAIPQYKQMFQDAYPSTPEAELGFQHAANAIAAFEAESFTTSDSRWDRYLSGDDSAISPAAKRGAHLFYGGANCSSCHSGNIMTDQEHHNIGVPQLGPGKDESGLDVGRMLVTQSEDDKFTFRTPPLRNTAVTGPWMHNGAYTELESAVRHFFSPESAIENFDVDKLAEVLRSTVRLEASDIEQLLATLDGGLPTDMGVTDQDINDLMAFLFSLTSPTVDMLPALTPDSVPSGLPVDGLSESLFSVMYDAETGNLMVDGPEGIDLDGFFLRILANGDSEPEFTFELGSAPWADETDIVLSDDMMAQSFIEYRSDASFLMSDGDLISAMLPAGMSAEALSDTLSVVYRMRGNPALWTADVTVVPEPDVLPLVAFGVLLAFQFRRRP
ncbi:MAG: hypothetical protein KDB27_11225 [Planctomycetales bacterium]|nr:hypothetical protein [Planctomycetales bacterium]